MNNDGTYVLYGGKFTRALLVEMVLVEGDIPYELRSVDIVNDEHRSPEFLAVNPAGWVPALITPAGEMLYETPAINLHLAEQHRITHLVPAFDDPQRGQFLSGFFSVVEDLEPILKRYFYPHRHALREEDTPAIKQGALDNALERLQVFEKRLAEGGPYHLGERFSLVDLTLGYWCSLIAYLGVLEDHPAVGRLTDLVIARPKLCAKFEYMDDWRAEYAALQERGGGVR